VKSEILKVISLKLVVFWDIAEELKDSIIKVIMEAVSPLKTLVNNYRTT
jgi:hypothetical protein